MPVPELCTRPPVTPGGGRCAGSAGGSGPQLEACRSLHHSSPHLHPCQLASLPRPAPHQNALPPRRLQAVHCRVAPRSLPPHHRLLPRRLRAVRCRAPARSLPPRHRMPPCRLQAVWCWVMPCLVPPRPHQPPRRLQAIRYQLVTCPLRVPMGRPTLCCQLSWRLGLPPAAAPAATTTTCNDVALCMHLVDEPDDRFIAATTRPESAPELVHQRAPLSTISAACRHQCYDSQGFVCRQPRPLPHQLHVSENQMRPGLNQMLGSVGHSGKDSSAASVPATAAEERCNACGQACRCRPVRMRQVEIGSSVRGRVRQVRGDLRVPQELAKRAEWQVVDAQERLAGLCGAWVWSRSRSESGSAPDEPRFCFHAQVDCGAQLQVDAHAGVARYLRAHLRHREVCGCPAARYARHDRDRAVQHSLHTVHIYDTGKAGPLCKRKLCVMKHVLFVLL